MKCLQRNGYDIKADTSQTVAPGPPFTNGTVVPARSDPTGDESGPPAATGRPLDAVVTPANTRQTMKEGVTASWQG